MGDTPRVETIENRWDILYRDYAEVYEAFASVPKTPRAIDVINARFPLGGKTVVDVGSGTGQSTFQLAEFAGSVIGVEIEPSMLEVAKATARSRAIENVRFVGGAAEQLPLKSGSVDLVAAMTLASLHNEENVTAFARESERVVKPGGLVLTVNIAPQWYGGDLAPVIYGKPRSEIPAENLRDLVFDRLGYAHFDYFSTQDYGTVEQAVRTYGFIFGKNAIDHIVAHGKTVIKWKIRISYKRVGAASR